MVAACGQPGVEEDPVQQELRAVAEIVLQVSVPDDRSRISSRDVGRMYSTPTRI
jgi:hypothetical protein